MISEKMQKALNDQINAELYSAYIYLSMSSYFTSVNLEGFATWMTVQTQEELSHAMKLFNYVNERGGRALMAPIEGPDTEWDSPLAAFETAYKHEQYVTGRINDLVKIAREENDTATEIMLQWFVSEQVEEEASADGIVQNLRLVQGAPGGIFMLDRELGARTFTPPSGGE